MQERTVDLGPVELAIHEAGAGGRPLLLVHGFTGAKEDFADHVDHLAERGWWVVAPDLRGHGASSKPGDEGQYSLDLLAADVWALVDALAWERLVLLGHSMGGMVVQVAALARAHALDGLVLMDTVHGPLNVDRGVAELGAVIAREQGMAALKAAQDALGAEAPLGTEAHQRLLAERPGYGEFGDRKLLAVAPAMYASMLPQMLDQADRLDALAGLHVPTLVLVGDQDRPFLKHSARMAERMARARQVIIPDAGHSPQFENPAAWREALVDFLDQL